MRKKVLLFGSTGFLGKKFLSLSGKDYDITPITRKNIDFEKEIDSIPQTLRDVLKSRKKNRFDACLFFHGIGPSLSTKNMEFEHFEKMIRINIIGPAIILNYLIDEKYLNNSSSVIFISSIAVKKGSYDCAYAASKSALSGLIQSFSKTYTDIRFNCLSLGLVDSSPTHLGMTPDFVEKHRKAMFDNKLIDPKDVINAARFLIENKGIAKTEISLDGGYKL